MKTYKYTDATNQVVHIIDEDGLSRGSCLASSLPEVTAILPADVPPIAQVRLDKWEQIKASRDQRKDGGVLVNGKWFHTDTGSRIQQLGLVLMGASVPAVAWKTMDGTFTTMSQPLAGQIFQAVAALDMALFAAAETHREAMEASDRPDLYDFSANWPAYFGQPA